MYRTPRVNVQSIRSVCRVRTDPGNVWKVLEFNYKFSRPQMP